MARLWGGVGVVVLVHVVGLGWLVKIRAKERTKRKERIYNNKV